MKFRSLSAPILVFFVGILHRLWQWHALSDQIARLAQASPDWKTMQYLPADLWQKHFAAALLYLQQTPPLPNLVYGLFAIWFPQAELRVAGLILLCGMLTCVAAALLAHLLMMLKFSSWFAAVIGIIFLGSSEILVMEYAELGQLLYEFMSMVLVVAAAIAAVQFAEKKSLESAVLLGLASTLLALTRATFSYFDLLAVCWLGFWWRPRPKLLLAAALPIVILHGGWALKQYVVLEHWQWATSTWGGANLQYGDTKRGDPRFSEWLATQPHSCADTWGTFATGRRFGAFGFPNNQALVLDMFENTEGAKYLDSRVAEQREQWQSLDSASFRDLSSCLQSLYLRYWAQYPLRAVAGAWRSYQLFWSPIDVWAATRANVILPQGGAVLKAVPVWRDWHNYLQARSFSIRQSPLQYAAQRGQGVFAPADIVVVPWLPHAMALVGCFGVHILPVMAIGAFARRHRQSPIDFPAGFSFLLLLFAYVAVLSSVVEYGENMRFRLPVEPVAWAIALIALDRCRCLSTAVYRRWRTAVPADR